MLPSFHRYQNHLMKRSQSMPPRYVSILLSALFALTGLSCGEAVVAPAVVKEVAVSGGGNPLRLAQSAQLGVALRGEGGVALPTVGVSWTSSDASVATVSASGQVTAVKRGTATISASAGGVTGTAAVPVIGVQRVDATPDSVSVIITQAAQLAVAVTADPGVTVTPTWVSRDTTLATVTSAGRVTAKSALGTTWVLATAEDQKDSVKVRVIPVPVATVAVTPAVWTLVAGQTVQLLATTKDSIGGLLTGRVITWTSSDTAKAVVGSGGLVTTKAAGAVTITATSEGKSAGAALTVLPPISTIGITPDTVRVILGRTVQFTAAPRAADGTVLDRAVSWGVNDTTVATISGTGVATTKKIETTRVTATAEGKTGTAVLIVIPAPVFTVAVTPATATLRIGQTLQLSAVPKDSAGNALGGRTVTWVSSDTAKARVSATGLVTARSTGAVTLRATSEGQTGTAELTVVIPVKSVTVTPGAPTLLAGAQVQLTAVAKDSLGTTLDREILWSSSNGLVASVSSTGLVTATGNGTAQIIATSEGVSGSATVTAAGGSGGTSSSSTIDTIQTRPAVVAYVSGDTGTIAFRPVDRTGLTVVGGATTTFIMGPVTSTNTNVTSGAVSCGSVGVCTQKLTVSGVAAGAAPVAVPLRIVATTGGGEGRITAVVVGTVADSLAMRFVPASSVAVPTVAVGDTVTMEAQLFYPGGIAAVPNVRFTLLTGSAGIAPCTVGWNQTQVPGGCVKVVPSLQGTVKVEALLPKLGGAGAWADTLELTAGTVQVASITVTPTTVIVGAGQSSTLTAELKDAFNAVLTGRIVTWSTSDAAIATVSEMGVVTGVKPGTTTVIAQSGNKTAVVTVNVTSAFNLRDQGLALSSGGNWEGGHACALDTSGAAWCWGNNRQYALGDGTNVIRRTQPARVAGDITFTNITSTAGTVCGLAVDGDIYCWGGGWSQLGNGTNNSSNTPVRVSSTKKFRSVSAGNNHVCAVTTDDEAYCWGNNPNGQLGNGESGNGNWGAADKNVPVKIALSEKVQAISAMTGGACVLTVRRETYCWGTNGSGQVGIGTTTNFEPTPKKVLGGYEFEALAGGGDNMCGQLSTGTVYCWGNNNYQMLGGSGNTLIPVATVFGGVPLRSIAIGNEHLCGTTADGSAYCSGSNDWGKLGVALTSTSSGQSSTPLQVSVGGPVSVIVPGEGATCAILRSGGARCWGTNDVGQLGTGTEQSSSTPKVIKGDRQFASLAPGSAGHATCGLDGSGKTFCWGMWAWNFVENNPWGIQVQLTPAATAGAFTFSQITKGNQFTCGIRTNGEAWCWGAGWRGQRGDGTTNSNPTPSRVNSAEAFVRISAGTEHACGVTASGATFCWGAGYYGAIGDGTNADRLSPVRIPGVSLASISAGEDHTCGLTSDGTAYCWGSNSSGQLGDGSNATRLSPVPVALNFKFSKIFAGIRNTCGIVIAPAGKLYCWGQGGSGELGIGAGTSVSVPTAVNSSLAFSSVVMTQNGASCGLTTGGDTYCWGYGGSFVVGSGVSETGNAFSPVRLAGDPGFVSIAAGYQHVCGVTAAKVTYCWGRNRYGGLTADVIPPTAVAGSTVFRGSR